MSINIEAHAHPVAGAWLITYVTMDDNQNVVCRTDLTATYKFASFHAVVRLEYVSQTGHLLGMSVQWEMDCGPAPLIGADHKSGTFTETAPVGTHEIRVVQIAQYSLDFSNLIGPIEWVVQAVAGAVQLGQFQVPTIPGNGFDTLVNPPNWDSSNALKGLVSVTSGTKH